MPASGREAKGRGVCQERTLGRFWQDSARGGGLSGRSNSPGQVDRPDPQRFVGGKKVTFPLLSREASM